MHEDGTTTTGDARTGVMVEFDHDIVEAIVTPQPITLASGRRAHRPIVPPVARVLAPSIDGADASRRQSRRGAWGAIGAPPDPLQAKSSARRRPIALALIGGDAAASERHRDRERACRQPAAPVVPWAAAYAQNGK